MTHFSKIIIMFSLCIACQCGYAMDEQKEVPSSSAATNTKAQIDHQARRQRIQEVFLKVLEVFDAPFGAIIGCHIEENASEIAFGKEVRDFIIPERYGDPDQASSLEFHMYKLVPLIISSIDLNYLDMKTEEEKIWVLASIDNGLQCMLSDYTKTEWKKVPISQQITHMFRTRYYYETTQGKENSDEILEGYETIIKHLRDKGYEIRLLQNTLHLMYKNQSIAYKPTVLTVEQLAQLPVFTVERLAQLEKNGFFSRFSGTPSASTATVVPTKTTCTSTSSSVPKAPPVVAAATSSSIVAESGEAKEAKYPEEEARLHHRLSTDSNQQQNTAATETIIAPAQTANSSSNHKSSYACKSKLQMLIKNFSL